MQRLASSTHLRGSGLATLMPRSSRPVRLARRGVAVSVLADGKADSGGFFGFATNTLKSGTQIMRRENGKAGTASKKAGTMRRGNRDGFTVFVAGATGRLGARIVWELLGQGFKVRAGVRSADKAETFLNIASSYSLLSKEELGRLQVVAFDLEKPDTITSAIGNAGKVVCAVGASESELGDLSAPRRIDGDGATRLVRAATAAGVYQFILITSLGTGKLGFPAGLLNLFGGVLVFKRRAEEALEASGLPYVIVRPGGMERPRDDYKLSHNVKLATRDKLFGGQVSRLQVAELVAAAAANPKLAENKVLEVVAETTAPAYSYENLLAAHPAEVSQEEREAEREAAALLTAQVEEANGQIAASEASLAKIRDTIKAATVQAATLRQQEQAVRKEQSEVLKQAERAEKQLAALRADADKKAVLAAAAKAVVSAAQQAQREGRLLSAQDVAAIKRSVVNPPKPVVEQPKAARAAAPAAAVGALFGGKRAVQAAEEKEEVEEVQPRKTAGLDLFGSFVRKVEVVAEEEEEEEEEEAPPPKSTFGFGFFGMQPKAVVVEEEQVEEEEEEAPAPPPKRQQQPAFAFFGGKQEVKKDAGEAAAAAAAATAAAQKAADDAATKEAAAAKAAAEQAAAKAAADEATAAKAAEAEAARLKKAREEEAEMLARKAEAAAKRRAEEEAIAARLAEEAAAKKAAEEDVRRAVAKKAVAEAAAKKAAERAAAEKAVAAAATAATPAPKRAGTPANVAEAHAWISNWQAKQQGGQQLEPAVQQLAAASDVVPANVAEARAWIAAWKAKQ